MGACNRPLTTMIMTTTLMSTKLKSAISGLSQPTLDVKTRTLALHDRHKLRKRPAVTVAEFRAVSGANGRRQTALKSHGLPGSLVCMWMMDKPITRHWRGRVERLAKSLDVSRAFDEEVDGGLHRS